MTDKQKISLGLFALGVIVFHKEYGGLLCAIGKSVNATPLQLAGEILRSA